MKYNHMVKHNGEYYPAGTEVPVADEKKSADVEAHGNGEADAETLTDGENGAGVEEKPARGKKATKSTE